MESAWTKAASALLCSVLGLSQDAWGRGSVALGWPRAWGPEGATGAMGSLGPPTPPHARQGDPLAHRLTRRQLSNVRARMVSGFSSQRHFIGAAVRRDPGPALPASSPPRPPAHSWKGKDAGAQ